MEIPREREFQRKKPETAAQPKREADTPLFADDSHGREPDTDLRDSIHGGGKQSGHRKAGDAPENRQRKYIRRRQQEGESQEPSTAAADIAEPDGGGDGPEGADTHTGPDREAAAHETSGHSGLQRGNRHRFQEAERAEEPKGERPGIRKEGAGAGKSNAQEGEAKKPSKLAFTADELPPETVDGKFAQARRKAERMEAKLEQAQKRLPSYRKLRMETTSDPGTGNVTKRLKFEKVAKPQGSHVRGPLPMRPAKAGVDMAGGYLHQKVYRSEDENVGIKAMHRAEIATEGGIRSALYLHKTAPYRRVSRLQARSVRAGADAAYRQALQDNPELKKKMLSRIWQKQKLKRQYAKTVREAQRTGSRIKDAAVTAEKLASRVVQSIKRHPAICGIMGLLLLLVFLLTSLISSFSNIGGGGLGSIFASTYLAEDRDIDDAETAYTEWEADLQIEINNVEADHPGYDEYRYQIDAIEHDPYLLMGYLTALYQNFSYVSVQDELRQIFGQQYELTFTEETEIRYRTETQTDPETGEETEAEVPYEWHILNVRLASRPFAEIIIPRMDADQKEICEILLQTKGNRQYVQNVFGFDWLGHVTSAYGYRVHPISGIKDHHNGVDIGVPQGTDILAGHDGTVRLAGTAGDYGLCAVLEGETYGGHTLTTKYGHCSQILVSVGQEVKAGDVIARVGSTGNSTGPHLHLEVLVDGQYLNPLYFADTGDTGGSLQDITAGGGSYFDYDIPPEALADDRFAAMIAEAEKYLGYPYVWGGSSPSTSFDCSGYVSWVANHSGWDLGRQTANGLLGVCTPVSGADARPGDLIFFKGTYNTSGASHVGIYVGNGMMIHCGNPISYANINTSYWQSHFYTFGRLP